MTMGKDTGSAVSDSQGKSDMANICESSKDSSSPTSENGDEPKGERLNQNGAEAVISLGCGYDGQTYASRVRDGA
jgi:hypothetical protein